MAEFSTPTNLGSSSNGRTSRLQCENARSIRVDSMGLSSKGKTPRSLRGDACSSHASSTAGEMRGSTSSSSNACSPRFARIRGLER